MEAAAPPPPPPPAPAPKRIEVGRVISEAFSIYGQHAGVLIGSAIVIYGIVGIINGLLYDEGGFFLRFLVNVLQLIAGAIYAGLVVRVVQHARAGTTTTIGEMFESVTPVIVPLIFNGILKGIAVVIGFFLLIVPGVILATMWAVTAPSIVVERSGIIDAFGRSWELVRGEFWPVLGALVIALLILMAAGVLALAIGLAIGDLVGAIILGIIFSALAAPVFGVVSAVLFFDLGGGQAAAPAAPAAPPPAAPAA